MTHTVNRLVGSNGWTEKFGPGQIAWLKNMRFISYAGIICAQGTWTHEWVPRISRQFVQDDVAHLASSSAVLIEALHAKLIEVTRAIGRIESDEVIQTHRLEMELIIFAIIGANED